MKDLILLGDPDLSIVTRRELEEAVQLLPSGVQTTAWRTKPSKSRERSATFLGTCVGFQYALVEFARNVAGIRDAGRC